MMADKEHTPGFVPISKIVDLARNEIQDFSTTNIELFTQLAVNGLKRLNMMVLDSVRVAYLEMTDINTAKLPIDYIKYSKIGIPINGKLWTLSLNNDILLPRGEKCGEDIRDLFANPSASVIPDYGYYFTDHYRDGRYISKLFGIGGGFNTAYYRIDEEHGQIVFDGVIPRSEIVLEYASSGIHGAQTLVPSRAESALMHYVLWRRLHSREDIPMNKLMYYKKLWEEEEHELVDFESQFTLSEYMDMLWGTWHQSVKR